MTIEEAVAIFGDALLGHFSSTELLDKVDSEEAANHYGRDIIGHFSDEEVIEYVGHENALNEIPDADIAFHCGNPLLAQYSAEDLLSMTDAEEAHDYFGTELLQHFTRDTLAEEIGHRIVGYLDTELILSDLSERDFSPTQRKQLSTYGGFSGFLYAIAGGDIEIAEDYLNSLFTMFMNLGFYNAMANYVEEH